MAKFYYAVRVGKHPGIYGTWDECNAEVNGYPGAQFKKFKTEEEAKAFIQGEAPDTQSDAGSENANKSTKNADSKSVKNNTTSFDSQKEISELSDIYELIDNQNDVLVAFVDGSYDVTTKKIGLGALIFTKDNETQVSDGFYDEELSTMRNVAGEIKASETVFDYAIEHNIKTAHIFYDYLGIEKWCTGEWKTNKQGTLAYKKKYDIIQPVLNVVFHKVKAHSNNQYNDIADTLAKKGSGIIA